jgi:hypothetical protein
VTQPAVDFIVATERLGYPDPEHRSRLARRLFGELQTRLMYDFSAEEPTATCHLQRHDHENALCGYQWEMLVRIPSGPE